MIPAFLTNNHRRLGQHFLVDDVEELLGIVFIVVVVWTRLRPNTGALGGSWLRSVLLAEDSSSVFLHLDEVVGVGNDILECRRWVPV